MMSDPRTCRSSGIFFKFAALPYMHILPALIAKHFVPLLNKQSKSVFAALSARVGSISDNRLGGWYAYRASKAALNMILKTSLLIKLIFLMRLKILQMKILSLQWMIGVSKKKCQKNLKL